MLFNREGNIIAISNMDNSINIRVALLNRSYSLTMLTKFGQSTYPGLGLQWRKNAFTAIRRNLLIVDISSTYYNILPTSSCQRS